MSAYFGHAGHHGNIDLHNALKSSGTSPNFLITLASLKSPVAGSPVRACDRADVAFLAR